MAGVDTEYNGKPARAQVSRLATLLKNPKDPAKDVRG